MTEEKIEVEKSSGNIFTVIDSNKLDIHKRMWYNYD